MVENARLRAAVYGRQSRGKAKSIAEQLAAGAGVIAENGWHHAGDYQDGSSASRYARKSRDDWKRVVADIESSALDILILWESSRGDRTLTTWSGLLDLCRERGVCIYVIADERLYDPRKPRDWKTLASAGVDSAGESDLLSLRVLRGQAGAAEAGNPSHGRTPYGYVRRYDPATGKLASQEPDPTTAPIVREVFERLAKGDAVSSIVNDFNERGVAPAGAARWHRARLRVMARNRAYIGERVYNGKVSEGTWPALVDTATFYAVQRVLADPARRTTRPGRAVHLLSFVATCGHCGGVLAAAGGRYRCEARSCVTIDQAEADRLVEQMVLTKLEQPETYGALRRRGDDDDQALVTMRGEVAALQARLDEWRLSAAKGQTSPASLAVVEAELSGQIAALQRRVTEAEVPPALQAILEPGTDVRARWKASSTAARRRIITHMATVVVGRAALPGSRYFDFRRLGNSRFAGDPMTWGERWDEAGV